MKGSPSREDAKKIKKNPSTALESTVQESKVLLKTIALAPIAAVILCRRRSAAKIGAYSGNSF
jgi:hypothetical protein